MYVGCYYIIQKGPKLSEMVSDGTNAWISACFAVGAAILSALVGVPLIKRQGEWGRWEGPHSPSHVRATKTGRAGVEQGGTEGSGHTCRRC